jgi:hypothetical protein
MADASTRNFGDDLVNSAAAAGGRMKDQFSDGVDRARQKGEQAARSAADAIDAHRGEAAGILERGADYLRSADVREMLSDAGDLIRRRPGVTLLVAALAGFLIAQALRSRN